MSYGAVFFFFWPEVMVLFVPFNEAPISNFNFFFFQNERDDPCLWGLYMALVLLFVDCYSL